MIVIAQYRVTLLAAAILRRRGLPALKQDAGGFVATRERNAAISTVFLVRQGF